MRTVYISRIPTHSKIHVRYTEPFDLDGVYEYIEKKTWWVDISDDRTYLYNSMTGIVLSVPGDFVYDETPFSEEPYSLECPTTTDENRYLVNAYVFTRIFDDMLESDELSGFLDELTS